MLKAEGKQEQWQEILHNSILVRSIYYPVCSQTKPVYCIFFFLGAGVVHRPGQKVDRSGLATNPHGIPV